MSTSQGRSRGLGRALATVVWLLSAAGCGAPGGPTADTPAPPDAAAPDGRDAGALRDDGDREPPDVGRDAARAADGQPADAGADAARDAGRSTDAAPRDTAADAGSPPDAPRDTAPDAGPPPDGPCYGPAETDELPARVLFRSRTTSFNRQWFVALREGRIWVKPNPDAGGEPGEWRLLGSGLPAGAGISHFAAPTAIVEISADGTWLHAISSAGVFYRGTDFTGDVHASFTWSDAWGHPGATGPGITIEFPTTFGWSVSDSQRAGVGYYEDRLGTEHSVGLGVAHVYRAGGTGRSLHFNDWWLPADWSRQICLPERGTLPIVGLSVSASTLFVVGTRGELWTRLYDFDTAGENDTLVYSFLITAPAGDTRALPAEDWRRQPDIPDGWFTSRITIFQDGQGNAARTLRVAGVRGGHAGYFEKRIFDPTWAFVETAERVCGPFLNAPGQPATAPGAPADHAFSGTLAVDRTFGPDVSVGIRIADFNVVCSPARAELLVAERPVTVGGLPLAFPLHHVHTLVLETRPLDYWQDGAPATIRAALVLPPELDRIDDAAARTTLQSLFGDRRGVNFQGSATLTELTLAEMTWLDPLVGVVPGDEKADPGDALQLRAVRP